MSFAVWVFVGLWVLDFADLGVDSSVAFCGLSEV